MSCGTNSLLTRQMLRTGGSVLRTGVTRAGRIRVMRPHQKGSRGVLCVRAIDTNEKLPADIREHGVVRRRTNLRNTTGHTVAGFQVTGGHCKEKYLARGDLQTVCASAAAAEQPEPVAAGSVRPGVWPMRCSECGTDGIK